MRQLLQSRDKQQQKVCCFAISLLWSFVQHIVECSCFWRFSIMQGPTLSNHNSPWCIPRIICNYVIALLALLVAAAVQRFVLANSVAAALEWQQTADPESGVHVEVGARTVSGRPIGPFTSPLYPNAIRSSPGGSSTQSTDSTTSNSSGSDAAPVRDVAAAAFDNATTEKRQSWWQLQLPRKAAAAAAERRADV
jgi:hypothetical protein